MSWQHNNLLSILFSCHGSCIFLSGEVEASPGSLGHIPMAYDMLNSIASFEPHRCGFNTRWSLTSHWNNVGPAGRSRSTVFVSDERKTVPRNQWRDGFSHNWRSRVQAGQVCKTRREGTFFWKRRKNNSVVVQPPARALFRDSLCPRLFQGDCEWLLYYGYVQ